MPIIILITLALIPFRAIVLSLMQHYHQHVLSKKHPINPEPTRTAQEKNERKTLWLGLCVDSLALCCFITLGIFKLNDFSWSGIGIILLSHALVVEPLYYGIHRLYHTPLGMKWLHKDHHYSTTTQPQTAISFYWVERLLYTAIFTPPFLIASLLGVLSLELCIGYILFIDILNIWGHFNVELTPKWWRHSVLKYIIYSPSYHTVHHRHPGKNLSLFMPIWDTVFKTNNIHHPKN